MRLLVFALALVVGAGCLGSPFDFEATAADARVIDGFSYDGSRVRRAEGSLTVQLDTEGDAGRVLVHLVDAGKVYDVVFNEFFGREPYKEGGVHRDFFEHGATGNGSGELPEFYAYVAAWGSATIRLNDQPLRDPTTLGPRWTAHLMIARGHVRDANTGAVYKSDGRAVFDPTTPADGFVNRTGAQAMLQLKTAANDLYYHFEFEGVRITRY